ncbi:MAG: ABC transporter substrate-binding protein, partial [Armatimonadota bacterium]
HIALRVALKIEIPMVNTADTDPTLTETRIPWLIRVNADDRHLGYGLAEHIFGVRGLERAAVLRTNEDYARRAVVEFVDTARRFGHPILMQKRFELHTEDFSTHLNDIRESQADCVVMWGEPDDIGRAVRQMRESGMEHPVFTGHRVVDPRFVEAAADAAEGVVAASQWDPTRADPKLKAFLTAYEERYEMPADTWAAHAYDGMCLLIKAVRKAGLNRARIMDSFVADYTLKTYEGVTGLIKFDHVLNDIGPVWLARYEGGRWVYEPAPRTFEIGLGAGLSPRAER